MKLVQLKLIIILQSIIWATFITQNLISADISKCCDSADDDRGSGGGSSYGDSNYDDDEESTPSLAAIHSRSSHHNTEITPAERWWLKHFSPATTSATLPAGIALKRSTNPYSWPVLIATGSPLRPPPDLFVNYLTDPASPEYNHTMVSRVHAKTITETAASTDSKRIIKAIGGLIELPPMQHPPRDALPTSTADEPPTHSITVTSRPPAHPAVSAAVPPATLLPFAPSGLRARRFKTPLIIKLDY